MMTKGEKIFSLFQSVDQLPPRDDLKAQWSELFCYLFLGLLYQEGADPKSRFTPGDLSGDGFYFDSGVYHSEIGRAIAKGLSERFYLLSHQPNLSDKEHQVLNALNVVFEPKTFSYKNLRGQELFAICELRDLDRPFVDVAGYLSVMIGQSEFYHIGSVPRLSLSLFGNIYSDSDTVLTLVPPQLIYGQVTEAGDQVTSLWSLLSSMTQSLSSHDYPGDILGETVTGYGFMTQSSSSEFIPLPRYATSLFLQSLMGLSSFNPIYVSALFYKQFLYGSIETKLITRYRLIDAILDSMKKEADIQDDQYLFYPDSYYRKLALSNVMSSQKSLPQASVFLKMAVEALDTNVDPALDTETSDTENEGGEEASPENPLETGGFENSMDLVSFNKVGEGINEDLYRSAVVALNDRMQADPTFPVTSDVKQALNQWVSGWVYRAAISATKDQIAALKLTQYLKPVSHIPTK